MRENNNPWIEEQEEEEKNKVEQVEKQKELLSTKDIEPKIKGLLNKLSPVNFDSISEQIWNYAKGSIDHLKTVVRMIFDKACDEPHFATQWAKLCKKIQDILSTSKSFDTLIQDAAIKDKQGHPASGVYLYRCSLLNRCQEQFEMEGGWWSNNSQQVSLNNVKMLSDEYYIAMKQKRQGLGLVVFIGELYKQEMLTSKVVGHCLTKLMEDKECVGDEEVETVCKLLSTIGETFDQVIQTKFWMNHYLQDMEKIIRTNKKLSTRVKFKVMDVIDLRKNQWISKEKRK
ncbi:armadillo-type protein [Circinella umbellata]|nr:armadillo-type protein [Circinella umbellata]